MAKYWTLSGILFATLFVNTHPALAVNISFSLPGVSATANPVEMIKAFYLYAISISGLLAFGMIVYGGVKYTLSAGNPGLQGDAKDMISQALIGLMLLLGVYLILSVINPGLTTLSLPSLDTLPDVSPITGAGSTAAGAPCENVCGPGEECRIGAGGAPTCQVIGNLPNYSVAINRNQLTDAAGRQFAHDNGLDIKPGASLQGIHQGVLDELARVKDGCGCSVTITAGTDGHHAPGEFSHAAGYKADVRLNSAFDNFVTSNFAYAGVRSDGAQMYRDRNSGALFAKESNHWDIQVK